MPDVSVIIPVYNVEAYLRQCLDSVVNQTLRDIEIICVDDGSTDGSAAILSEYAANDPRVKVFSTPNSGTVVARKRAVASASGEWCLFLDPDDWISPDTCERMLAAAAASGADAVQCGFVIEATEPRPAALRAKTEAYFNRPPAIHDGATLVGKIYLKHELAWNLIGRMIRADICKPAFAEQANAYSINETDVYATFHLVFRISSLEVIGERLYHYRCGVGISTRKRLSLEDYLRTMGKFDTWRELVDFAADRHPCDMDASNALASIGRMMAINQFTALAGRVCRPGERARGFSELLATCPHGLLSEALSERYADCPATLAQMLDSAGGLPKLVARDVHHVGVHYFHLTAGGVQRVIDGELKALRAKGIEITLFIDDNGEPIDMSVPADVPVVRIPKAVGAGTATATERMRALASELSARRIDVFYSHQYLSERMIWDILAAKLVCGIPFFVRYHSVCTAPLWAMPSAATYCNEPYWLRQCDGVFTVTPFDAAVLAAGGVRARYLPNPMSESVLNALASPVLQKDPNLVVWVGRLSEEKHPGDAIRVFGALRRANPNLRFALVGGGPDKLVSHLHALAAAEGVSTAVEFAGKVADPSPWYVRASVLISTSDYEGCPLVVQEALANGVPVVAYAQPQIMIFRGNPAAVPVRPRSVADMTAAVLDVMSRKDIAALRESARMAIRRLPQSGVAEGLLEAFSGADAPAYAFTAEDLGDLLTLQRRALASLHSRRTKQIRALVDERDQLKQKAKEQAK